MLDKDLMQLERLDSLGLANVLFVNSNFGLLFIAVFELALNTFFCFAGFEINFIHDDIQRFTFTGPVPDFQDEIDKIRALMVMTRSYSFCASVLLLVSW